MNLTKQRSFNYGQIYVALSRVTSLNGLHILGEIQSKHIKANPKVNSEYERLRTSSSAIVTTPTENEDFCLTISLLNVRSQEA